MSVIDLKKRVFLNWHFWIWLDLFWKGPTINRTKHLNCLFLLEAFGSPELEFSKCWLSNTAFAVILSPFTAFIPGMKQNYRKCSPVLTVPVTALPCPAATYTPSFRKADCSGILASSLPLSPQKLSQTDQSLLIHETVPVDIFSQFGRNIFQFGTGKVW